MISEDLTEPPDNVSKIESVVRRYLPGLLSLVPLIYSVQFLRFRESDLDMYGTSYYFFTYQHGFLRRALVGQMLAHVSFLSARFFIFWELGIFLLAASATYLFFRKQIFGTWNERMLWGALLSGPAMLPQFSYLEGHIDALLYCFLLIACYAICRWPNMAGLVLSTAISLVAMLQHEGYIFMFYPALFVLTLTQVVRGRLRILPLLFSVLLLTTSFFLILHYGNLKVPAAQALSEATARTDAPLDHNLFMETSRGFKGQLIEAIHVYLTLSTIPAFVLSLVLAIPYFVLLRSLLRRSLGTMKVRSRLSAALFFLHCWCLSSCSLQGSI